jgi:hypothetical protein
MRSASVESWKPRPDNINPSSTQMSICGPPVSEAVTGLLLQCPNGRSTASYPQTDEPHKVVCACMQQADMHVRTCHACTYVRVMHVDQSGQTWKEAFLAVI